MKIIDVKIDKINIKLKNPVKVSFGILEHTENFFITITLENNVIGLGEVANIEYITHVSNDQVHKDLEAFKNLLINKDIENWKDLIRELDKKMLRPSLCGFDMAIIDAAAKHKGVPAYKLLGNSFVNKSTNYTLGIMSKEDTLQKAQEFIKNGKTNIKIKVGADINKDIETINYLLENTDIDVRLDANQGWSYEELKRFINSVEMSRIILIEEPFLAGEYDLLAQAQKEFHNVFLLADETCSTVQDAQELADRDAVKGFNIKLIKCGGLLNAININNIAKAKNIKSMLGCMTETKLALSAAAHLVVSDDNIIACDLDSYTFLADEGKIESTVKFKETTIEVSNALGYGIK